MIMTTLFILQGVVPAGLVAWFYLRPSRSKPGRLAQVVASLLWMFAIALMGVWTLLPWWIPYACTVVLVATALGQIPSWPSLASRPVTRSGWVTVIACTLLTFALVQPIRNAIGGRQPPPGATLNLQLPFASGRFLVVNGGSHVSINAHNETLDSSVPRYRPWRGQSYGVDLVELDLAGLRAEGIWPEQPERYFIYGTEALAPCAGTVTKTRDGVPDNLVPETNPAEMAGNYVMLRCDDVDVVLAHLRAGSISVHSGTHVLAGAVVGVIGNSGNSDEPHLHIHAQTPGTAEAPFSGEPVAIRFDGRFPVRGDHFAKR